MLQPPEQASVDEEPVENLSRQSDKFLVSESLESRGLLSTCISRRLRM
jgi:hypothetical protein